MKKLLLYILIAGTTFVACSKSEESVEEKIELTNLSATIIIKDIEQWDTNTKVFLTAYNKNKQLTAIYTKELEKPTSNILNIESNDIPLGGYTDIQIEVKKNSITKVMAYYGNFFILKGQNNLANKSMNIDGVAPKFLFTKIQQQIFNTSCVQCHSNTLKEAELDLSEGFAYNALINKNSTIKKDAKLVSPSNADKSFLITVLKDEGNLTQLHATKISSAELSIIEEWINEAAKEE